MKRRQWLCTVLGAAGTCLASATTKQTQNTLVWRQRVMMGFGTTVWLQAAHHDTQELEKALSSCVALLHDIERELSLYLPSSALCRLNAAGSFQGTAPHLFRMLKIANNISSQCNGMFDVTMQPLWQVWRAAHEDGNEPSAKLIDTTCQLVNWRGIAMSQDTIKFKRKGMSVSLNGIAQGYAADQVRIQLASYGIQTARIDTGETTSLQPIGSVNSESFFIEDRFNMASGTGPVVVPNGRAMATSSDAHTTFFSHHEHHILQPQTGHSPHYWASVTVIANSCTLADALTKVFFMLPSQQIQAAADRWGVAVVLQNKTGHWQQVNPTSHINLKLVEQI